MHFSSYGPVFAVQHHAIHAPVGVEPKSDFNFFVPFWSVQCAFCHVKSLRIYYSSNLTLDDATCSNWTYFTGTPRSTIFILGTMYNIVKYLRNEAR